jgi:hypothetical protein
MKKILIALLTMMIGLLLSCSNDDTQIDDTDGGFFSEYDSRNFEMGFSTWPYAPTVASVDDTYDFIGANAENYFTKE